MKKKPQTHQNLIYFLPIHNPKLKKNKRVIFCHYSPRIMRIKIWQGNDVNNLIEHASISSREANKFSKIIIENITLEFANNLSMYTDYGLEYRNYINKFKKI